MRLKDHVVIITGVSHAGQAGFALAKAFAREGAYLAISSRSAERGNARAEELHAEGTQGHKKRRNSDSCNQGAVEGAHQSPGSQPGQDSGKQAVIPHGHGGCHRSQPGYRTDR